MRGLRNRDTPIAISTKNLFSKYHSPLNGTCLLRKITDFRTMVKKFPIILEHFFAPKRKQGSF